MKRALAAVLLAASPAAAQVVKVGAVSEALPIGGGLGGISAFEGALLPLELAPALKLSLTPAAAVPTPAGVPAAQDPAKRPVTAYDRSQIAKNVAAKVAERRAAIVADMADDKVIRFPLPKTRAFVEAVAAKLLSSSGLAGHLGPNGMLVRVNDTTWGDTGASMSAGVLTAQPEMIAIMSSEDEVAAVIAHEIIHYIRAHDELLVAARGWSLRPSGGDIFGGGPRMSDKEIAARLKHETEADALSLRLLVNAGYDPEAAVSALLVIQNERNTEPRYSFERGRHDPTHPTIEQRVVAMRQIMRDERMSPSKRTAGGLPEVYEELKNRRREYKDGKPRPDESSASDLYQHYKRPKVFVP